MTKAEIKSPNHASLKNQLFNKDFETKYYFSHNKTLNRDFIFRHSRQSQSCYKVEAFLADKENPTSKLYRAGDLMYDMVHPNYVAAEEADMYVASFDVADKCNGINCRQAKIGRTLFNLMKNHLITEEKFRFYLYPTPSSKDFPFSFAQFMEGRITPLDQLEHVYKSLGLKKNGMKMCGDLTSEALNSLESLNLQPLDCEPDYFEKATMAAIRDLFTSDKDEISFDTRLYTTYNTKLKKDIIIRHRIVSNNVFSNIGDEGTYLSQKYLIEALLPPKATDPKQELNVIGKVDYGIAIQNSDGSESTGYLNKFRVEPEHNGQTLQKSGIGSQLFKLMESHMIENKVSSFSLFRAPDEDSFFSFAAFMSETPVPQTDLIEIYDQQLRYIYEDLGMVEPPGTAFSGCMKKELTSKDAHTPESLGLKPLSLEPYASSDTKVPTLSDVKIPKLPDTKISEDSFYL